MNKSLVELVPTAVILLLMTACQSQGEQPKDQYQIEVAGESIVSSRLPYAFQQGRYELEYAKRISERTLLGQFLSDAVRLTYSDTGKPVPEGFSQDLHPEKRPSEPELRAFYEQRKAYLPGDFDSNRELIRSAYDQWLQGQLRHEHLREGLKSGSIKISDPYLPRPHFDLSLPEIPSIQSGENPKLEVLVVSVKDCAPCIDRERYLMKVLEERKDKNGWIVRFLDSYPGDTRLDAYQAHRQLLCAAPTSVYRPIRQLVFQEPVTKDLGDQIWKTIPDSERSAFENCLKSNWPEQVTMRNNRIASELYAKQLYSIYINHEKLAFPTEELLRQRLIEGAEQKTYP